MLNTDTLSATIIRDAFIHEYIFMGDSHIDLSDSDLPLIEWFFENILAIPDSLSEEMEYMLGVDEGIIKGSTLNILDSVITLSDQRIINFNDPVHNLKKFLDASSLLTRELFSFKPIYSKLILTDEEDEFEFNENSFKRVFTQASPRIKLAFAKDLKNYIKRYEPDIGSCADMK